MDPLDITDKEALLAMLETRRRGKSRTIDEADMVAALKRRVQGQDHIVEDLARFIRLQWGKETREQPIANVLLVGPPATGKTELAKALAEYLFDDEKNMIRIDCSELKGPEGIHRLIGTPTGYVGAEKGGYLTRPMLSNPKRLVLFDEIEKAYSGVFDLLLSLMGEGRLTEQGSNRVADFTQSLIVLTSNAAHESMGRLREQLEDVHELANAVREELINAKTFRPEIISRFDHIYVFKPLDELTQLRVASLKVIKAGKEYGVAIKHIAKEMIFEIALNGTESQDARELKRRVDDTLGELLLSGKEQGFSEVDIVLDEAGKPMVRQAELDE